MKIFSEYNIRTEEISLELIDGDLYVAVDVEPAVAEQIIDKVNKSLTGWYVDTDEEDLG